MPIARVILAGWLAALAVAATPGVARNSAPQKTDDNAASSSCHAYQQAPDGSWTERPCEEQGARAQTQHKQLGKGAEEEPR